LPCRIGIGSVEIREGPLHPIKQSSGSLQGDDGVIKRCLVRVRCDGVDFLELLLHPGLSRRHKLVVLDLVERGEAIRQRTLSKKWIVSRHGRRILFSGNSYSRDLHCCEQREAACS